MHSIYRDRVAVSDFRATLVSRLADKPDIGEFDPRNQVAPSPRPVIEGTFLTSVRSNAPEHY
jgi:hypothetical protein